MATNTPAKAAARPRKAAPAKATPAPAASASAVDPEVLDRLTSILQQGADAVARATPPEPGEADDRPVFVANGFVRFQALDARGESTSTVTLRRPKMGEYSALRTQLEAIQDEIDTHTSEATAVLSRLQRASRRPDRRLQAITDRLNADERGEVDIDDDEFDALVVERDQLMAEQAERNAEMRHTNAKLRHKLDEIRVRWLDSVLSTLAIDAVPEAFEWPAWAADGGLMGELVKHWRMRPLDHG